MPGINWCKCSLICPVVIKTRSQMSHMECINGLVIWINTKPFNWQKSFLRCIKVQIKVSNRSFGYLLNINACNKASDDLQSLIRNNKNWIRLCRSIESSIKQEVIGVNLSHEAKFEKSAFKVGAKAALD